MTIDVLIFGAASRAAGTDRVPVTVGDSPTTEHIAAALAEQHPALRFAVFAAHSPNSAPHAARLAVNHAFAPPGTIVHAHDEVALITLVSGG